MTCHLDALCFDANDPLRLSRFWAGVLGWAMADDAGESIAAEKLELLPSDDTGFRIRFLPTQKQKAGQNQMHLDLTSTSLEDQQQTVARSLDLGARHIDIGQRPEEGHVVLADPEGNEFCVIEPGNNFLADCGFVGALACDGSQEVGYFWSGALNWPLVWDQDQETAIRSPLGGPKITWAVRATPPLCTSFVQFLLFFVVDLFAAVDFFVVELLAAVDFFAVTFFEAGLFLAADFAVFLAGTGIWWERAQQFGHRRRLGWPPCPSPSRAGRSSGS